MNFQEMKTALNYMRVDSAIKNKKGIAFIGASIILWMAILCIHLSALPIEKKNLYTFFTTALLMPIAYIITRLLKISLNNKNNPINKVGLLFTGSEVLYLIIVCWVYTAVPEKMIMVLAMIFGGHLLPFGWLYISKAYIVSSVIVTVGALIIGCLYNSWMVALFMLLHEILLTIVLYFENKKILV